MNPTKIAWMALVISVMAFALQIENRIQLHDTVTNIVNQREKDYSTKLAESLNKSRELMGFQAVSPTNYAQVLTSYFESMAMVMNGVISNSDDTIEKRPRPNADSK